MARPLAGLTCLAHHIRGLAEPLRLLLVFVMVGAVSVAAAATAIVVAVAVVVGAAVVAVQMIADHVSIVVMEPVSLLRLTL